MKRKYPVSIAAAARKLGVLPNVIYFRLRMGWPLEKAITQPKGYRLKKELLDKDVYGGCKKYKSFDDSVFKNEKVFADNIPEKFEDKINYTSVGGWKIIYLNYIKKGEYIFQAVNTDGRKYATNDPIEIHSILEEIFANVCKR